MHIHDKEKPIRLLLESLSQTELLEVARNCPGLFFSSSPEGEKELEHTVDEIVRFFEWVDKVSTLLLLPTVQPVFSSRFSYDYLDYLSEEKRGAIIKDWNQSPHVVQYRLPLSREALQVFYAASTVLNAFYRTVMLWDSRHFLDEQIEMICSHFDLPDQVIVELRQLAHANARYVINPGRFRDQSAEEWHTHFVVDDSRPKGDELSSLLPAEVVEKARELITFFQKYTDFEKQPEMNRLMAMLLAQMMGNTQVEEVIQSAEIEPNTYVYGPVNEVIPHRGLKIHVPFSPYSARDLSILQKVAEVVKKHGASMKAQMWDNYNQYPNPKGITVYPLPDKEGLDPDEPTNNFRHAFELVKALDEALMPLSQGVSIPYSTDISLGRSGLVAIRYGELRAHQNEQGDVVEFTFADGWLDSRERGFWENIPSPDCVDAIEAAAKEQGVDMHQAEDLVSAPEDGSIIPNLRIVLQEEEYSEDLFAQYSQNEWKIALFQVWKEPACTQSWKNVRNTLNFASHLVFTEDDFPNLFQAFFVLPGRYPHSVISRLITHSLPDQAYIASVAVQEAIIGSLVDQSISLDTTYRLITYYQRYRIDPSIGDAVIPFLTTKFESEVSIDARELKGQDFEEYVMKCLSHIKYHVLPSVYSLAYEKVLGLLIDKSSDTSQAMSQDEIHGLIVSHLCTMCDMPGASELLTAAVASPGGAREYAIQYHSSFELRSMSWADGVYERLKNSGVLARELDQIAESTHLVSRNVPVAPGLSLLPDPNSEHVVDTEQLFVSNGVVAIHNEDIQLPEPYKEGIRECFPDASFRDPMHVHFLPFDRPYYNDTGDFMVILKMMLRGALDFQQYLDSHSFSENTVIFGYTNDKMMNVIHQFGFVSPNASTATLQEDGYSAVCATVRSVQEAIRSNRFHKLAKKLSL